MSFILPSFVLISIVLIMRKEHFVSGTIKVSSQKRFFHYFLNQFITSCFGQGLRFVIDL